MFRGLRPDEIDVRIGSVTAKGVSLLLYKDARCDMNILDETLGPQGWQRKHEVINGNLYCGIGIWNGDINEWIWKWDCGTESYTEKEKGEASDSFKRAAFNVGIGRELYTAGFIFIPCPTKKKDSGKGYELENTYQFSGIRISDIEYRETENKREIVGLTIVDRNGKDIYKRGQIIFDDEQDTEDVTDVENKLIGKVQLASLEAELARTGVKKTQILKEYMVFELKELTLVQFSGLMKRLEKVKTKQKVDLGL